MPIAKSVPNAHEESWQLFIKQDSQVIKLLSEGYVLQAVHKYYDRYKQELYRKLRLKNTTTGEKWIRPFILAGQSWKIGEPEFPNGKPLYNLPTIYANPKATIFVLEGEFKTDVLNKKLVQLGFSGKCLATTSGSATSAGKTDWAPLKNREVVIWPDNDKPGFEYARQVAQHIEEVNSK